MHRNNTDSLIRAQETNRQVTASITGREDLLLTEHHGIQNQRVVVHSHRGCDEGEVLRSEMQRAECVRVSGGVI